jgi:hypothetical protein
MTRSLVVTCPDFDRMTRYLSTWAGEILRYCEAHGNATFVLSGEKANRRNLESFVKKHQPNILFLNGHGDDSRVAGHNNDIILDKDNVKIAAGTNVYALSCNSAAKLGALAMKNGAAGYIGYTKEFIMLSSATKTAHGAIDGKAKLFLEPSNVIVQSLAKGSIADDAAGKGRQAFLDSIKKAINSDIQSDDDKLVPYLFWDMKCLVSCHD